MQLQIKSEKNGNRIWTHDLRVASAILYQLSFESLMVKGYDVWAILVRVRFVHFGIELCMVFSQGEVCAFWYGIVHGF